MQSDKSGRKVLAQKSGNLTKNIGAQFAKFALVDTNGKPSLH